MIKGELSHAVLTSLLIITVHKWVSYKEHYKSHPGRWLKVSWASVHLTVDYYSSQVSKLRRATNHTRVDD